jgi:hypothetical protein
VNRTWEVKPVQVVIKENEYKGQVSYAVAFINDYERTPGATSNVDAKRLNELSAAYGPGLRALASSVSLNATKPSGKPAAAPRSTKTADVNKELASAAVHQGNGTEVKDDIPF